MEKTENTEIVNNQQLKKRWAEFFHEHRLIVIGVVVIPLIILISVAFLKNSILGWISLVLLLGSYGLVIYNGFLSFRTDHNFAQLAFGKVILEVTFVPGALIWVLPGYHIVEEKNGMLLDRNEMNIKIPKREVQFKAVKNQSGEEKSRRDSVNAVNVRINYYLDVLNIYRFLMLAPNDFEKSLSDNSLGDFGSAFQDRVTELEKAKDFKDFQFYIQSDIDNEKEGIPSYVYKEGIWLLVDKDENGDYKKPTFFDNSISDEEAEKRYIVPEFETTLKRAKRYGILLKNITIGDFEDSEETDDTRNEIRRQDFKNETKDKVSEGRQRRVREWMKLAENDDSIKNKLEWATNQVNMEDESRKEIATGTNVILDAK